MDLGMEIGVCSSYSRVPSFLSHCCVGGDTIHRNFCEVLRAVWGKPTERQSNEVEHRYYLWYVVRQLQLLGS